MPIFTHREQSECAADHDSFEKNTGKEKLWQVSFESRLHDFGNEEHCILAFINPFSLSEKEIMKMPSIIQMELIDLKTISSVKMKFD